MELKGGNSMNITTEELRIIALNVVSENQNESINTEEGVNGLTYTVAYNDGVLDLLNAILEKKGESI